MYVLSGQHTKIEAFTNFVIGYKGAIPDSYETTNDTTATCC